MTISEVAFWVVIANMCVGTVFIIAVLWNHFSTRKSVPFVWQCFVLVIMFFGWSLFLWDKEGRDILVGAFKKEEGFV